MKLSFSHSVTERRKLGGTVNQEMIITVDYDPYENGISNPTVEIIQDGKVVCEISKLLDKAEGGPLVEMLEAIEWRTLYYDEKIDDENSYSPLNKTA